MNIFFSIFICIYYLIFQCLSENPPTNNRNVQDILNIPLNSNNQNDPNEHLNMDNIGLINNASLTNIITFTDVYFRFIEMIKTKEENLLIKTSSSSYSLSVGKRIFFGLNKNGRFYFENSAMLAFKRAEEAFAGEALKAGFETEDDLQNYMKEIRKEVRGR